MNLTQKDQDVSAQTDIQLGGAPVDDQGNWTGMWQQINGKTATDLTLFLAPTSATLIHFIPATSSTQAH